ncbi:MBL fold metallo-hydrolase [Phyllobacterium sp. 21LDTY02-6]|uniref:MBL fold metallo-hydrolase n=1 Tax=Phyllobacterium sp. 21LDTY02-6 TaxID=2944903 RepID=UPI002020FA7D|nr:MBL fold metallo-hydrolase [Phyllobacterium sp. 21LDTY02-6]MCO4317683.1 MBL fold metallo-hydrolase [Phyllobacterium sp. 21LDTY02-6]
MRVDFHGGFGEKGRTSLGISEGNSNLLFDAGIKVGAKGRDYYPMIEADAAAALDAVFISHAHEDHIGGLAWLWAQGFRGRIAMTAETLAEMPAMLAQYGEAEHLGALPELAAHVELFEPGDDITIGGIEVGTGRSGHVAGGVWYAARLEGRRIVYTADIVPDSAVFAMDPIPACDLLVFDASYGDDAISGADRAHAIKAWIEEQSSGCLLPVPLSGKPLELIAILPERFAVHASMRDAIAAQVSAGNALKHGARALLERKLQRAVDWSDGDALPDCPLLTFDGMGSAGPSVEAIAAAAAQDYPVLLTGHIPANTPASSLHGAGRAAWIRLPTHPTRPANVKIWHEAGQPLAVGHSCERGALQALKAHMPRLDDAIISGDHLFL